MDYRQADNINYHQIYLDGKNCALRGGQSSGNPYFSRQKIEYANEGIVWLKGFKDYKIPDPNCSQCNGKGKLPTDTGKYGIVDFPCYCNKSDRFN